MDKAPSYPILMLTSCVVGLGCYTAAYMRIPILPLYARSLGIGPIEIGIINSLLMLAAGILSVPLGILSDRLGRKRLVLTGILVTAASSYLLALSRTSPQMMLISVFAGLGLAAFGPTMMSFVADFSPLTHRGRTYGWYTMTIYGGMGIGPAIGGLFAQLLNFRWVFTISAILGCAVFSIALLFFPKSNPAWHEGTQKRNNRKIVWELLRNNPYLVCLLVTLFGTFSLGAFITFLPLHASDRGIKVGQIGLIFAIQAIVNALGRFPFGYLCDRFTQRRVLTLVGLLAYSLSNVGLALSNSLAMFLMSALIMGIGMGIAFTAVATLISELVPAASRGLAMGAFTSCIYLGQMLSSSTMGVVAGKYGFQACFLITAGMIVVASVTFSLIFKPGFVSPDRDDRHGEQPHVFP
ncbi:MAG TPA: MFS transporter [Syntrophobacteraceae bacterium]|nr:MFS transporter [Syntrophobacteraceae bacterium]